MTKDNEEWGNVSLPGLDDDKLFNTNWNHVAGIKDRNQDPKYLEAIKKRTESEAWKRANKEKAQKVVQTESWQLNHAKGMEKMKNDPVWQQQQQERFERRSKNEVWLQRKTEANRRLATDEDWLNNTANANKSRCSKPLVTPVGVFPSITEAGKAYNEIKNYNNGRKLVMGQLKNNTAEFYHITKEEYIMLTGKDIV